MANHDWYIATMVVASLVIYCPWRFCRPNWFCNNNSRVTGRGLSSSICDSLGWLFTATMLVLLIVGMLLIRYDGFEDRDDSSTSGKGVGLVMGGVFGLFIGLAFVACHCSEHLSPLQQVTIMIASLLLLPGLSILTTAAIFEAKWDATIDYEGPMQIVGVGHTSTSITPHRGPNFEPHTSYYGFLNVTFGGNNVCGHESARCEAQVFVPECQSHKNYEENSAQVEECVTAAYNLEETVWNGTNLPTAYFAGDCETCKAYAMNRVDERSDFLVLLHKIGIIVSTIGGCLIIGFCLKAYLRSILVASNDEEEEDDIAEELGPPSTVNVPTKLDDDDTTESQEQPMDNREQE